MACRFKVRRTSVADKVLLGAPLLGSRLVVGRLALTQATGVRCPASQPNLQHGVCSSTGRALDF